MTKIHKLNSNWDNVFGSSFETEEDVIEFIFEHLDTSDFENSFTQMGFDNNPSNTIKYSASEKREALYDFMMWLVNDKEA